MHLFNSGMSKNGRFSWALTPLSLIEIQAEILLKKLLRNLDSL
jgi:hypothetical protein